MSFQIQFSEEATEEDLVEIWALEQFLRSLPESRMGDWSGGPIKSESPDFLIRREDGTTLGIEVTHVADESEMTKRGMEATVCGFVKAEFLEKTGENLHLDVHFGADSGPLPVQQLVEEILRIVRAAPRLPNYLERRLSFSANDVFAHKCNIRLGSCRFEIPGWKQDVADELDEFSTFVSEIEFGHRPEGTPEAGRVAAGWQRVLTPEMVRKSEVIDEKEEKLGAYLSQCEECWLLLHAEPFLSSAPMFGAEFEVEVEAFEETDMIETEFDAVWAVGNERRVARVG